MNFWSLMKPQNCFMKFWMEEHFSGVSTCSFHDSQRIHDSGPNRLPIALPTSGLLSHYPENLVHSKTMKFKVSQIPYSESSLRLSGCSVLCSWHHLVL